MNNTTSEAFEQRLGVWDFVVIVSYFVACLAVGIYSLCRPNRGTVTGYFLAGRHMTWLPVGASLFASNIGSEHFIGLAGSAAAKGLGVAAFEFQACPLFHLMVWVFLPVYIASGVCTIPEYMTKRFGGGRIQVYLAFLSLLLYIFTKISVNMFAGSLFIQQALGWDIYTSILLLLAFTAVFTVTGGLAAVIYTDTLQTFVMVIGATVLAVLSYIKVGGFTGIYEKYPTAIANTTLESNSTCGYPSPQAFKVLRGPLDDEIPWPGFFFGEIPMAIWYLCTDQMIVQRALAAKSLSHAQGGAILTSFLKFLPLYIIIFPGMISRILYPDEVACSDPDLCYEICRSRMACTNIAYPRLVLGLMPIGLRGLMMAVMLAALMTSLTSIFNSASTLFTMDIYTKIRKKATTRELMVVGRVFVLVMIGISILWIPMIKEFQGGQLFIYVQVLSAHLSPPIAAVYLIAMFWKRGNEQGAFYGLLIGFIIGVVRMIMDFIYIAPKCGEPDNRPSIAKDFHYMYFALVLFWVVVIVNVVVSLMTRPPEPEMLHRTTYWTRNEHKDLIENSEEMKEIAEEVDERSSDHLDDRPANHVDDRFTNHVDESTADADDKFMNEGNLEDGESLQYVGFQDEKDDNPPARKSVLRRVYDNFCGFDDSTEAQIKLREQEAHLRGLAALKQDKMVKMALKIMRDITIAITIFLYGYYSAPQNFVHSALMTYGNIST
ncbi:sodium/mannose cotransporter SLC5A10-like [Lineus longissimus]|uniref:sodium/mannose cotransporter SLC5A10-like n=1 Tax=Lineus longissimus TaxID=88925 RepID=UPI002B4D8EFE